MMSTLVSVNGVVEFDGKFLIMKRSPTKKFGANMWEVPGGTPKEKEFLEDAMFREVEEETGLKVKIGNKHVIQVKDDHGEWLAVYFECAAQTNTVTMSEEHTEFMWADLEKIKQLNIYDSLRKMIEMIEAGR